MSLNLRFALLAASAVSTGLAASAHAGDAVASTAPAAAPASPTPAPAHTPPAAEGLKAGTAAPTFMLPVVNELADPQGKKVSKWGPGKWTALPPGKDGQPAADQKKLVLMSFFATYCEPCKKEMPELARLFSTYKDQGLGVMLVSIDKGDEQKQQIIDLAKASEVTFPVMHDRFQVVARRYSAERLPYMLLLDGTGNIKTVHIGYTEELKAGLENEVRQGLGLAPLAPAGAPAKPGAKPAKKAAAKGKG